MRALASNFTFERPAGSPALAASATAAFYGPVTRL
jgi:hypothetical protein